MVGGVRWHDQVFGRFECGTIGRIEAAHGGCGGPGIPTVGALDEEKLAQNTRWIEPAFPHPELRRWGYLVRRNRHARPRFCLWSRIQSGRILDHASAHHRPSHGTTHV